MNNQLKFKLVPGSKLFNDLRKEVFDKKKIINKTNLTKTKTNISVSTKKIIK